MKMQHTFVPIFISSLGECWKLFCREAPEQVFMDFKTSSSLLIGMGGE